MSPRIEIDHEKAKVRGGLRYSKNISCKQFLIRTCLQVFAITIIVSVIGVPHLAIGQTGKEAKGFVTVHIDRSDSRPVYSQYRIDDKLYRGDRTIMLPEGHHHIEWMAIAKEFHPELVGRRLSGHYKEIIVRDLNPITLEPDYYSHSYPPRTHKERVWVEGDIDDGWRQKSFPKVKAFTISASDTTKFVIAPMGDLVPENQAFFFSEDFWNLALIVGLVFLVLHFGVGFGMG